MNPNDIYIHRCGGNTNNKPKTNIRSKSPALFVKNGYIFSNNIYDKIRRVEYYDDNEILIHTHCGNIYRYNHQDGNDPIVDLAIIEGNTITRSTLVYEE